MGRVASTFRLPGVRLGGVLAAAVAAMALVQQGLGLVKPPPLAQVLVLLAALFLGLAAGRAARVGKHQDAQEEREGLLGSLLRRWPMASLHEVDPHALGVFPSDVRSKHGAALPDYVPRDVDTALRTAIADYAFVLVFGPANAGKSRTAYEAASEVLKDTTVLVPEDGEALRQLLDLKPWQQEANTPGLLWLDGLERYLPSLDRGSLDRLTRSLPRSKTVATMRDDDYRQLFQRSGDDADAGKRILTRARTLRLDAKLSESERKRAAELYPQLDVSRGIGDAFAADWSQDHVPPPAREEPEPGDLNWRARVRDVDRHVGAYLMVFLILVVLTSWMAATGHFHGPVSVPKQLDAIHRAASHTGQRVLFSKAVDFHGGGEKSYLMVLRDKSVDSTAATRGAATGGATADATAPRSDELRIYDKQDDNLVRKFTFRPAPDRTPYAFRAGANGDWDGNGSDEMIAGFGPLRADTLQPVPVSIYWDSDAEKYAIEALKTKPTALKHVGDPGRGARKLRAAYGLPVELHDPHGAATSGYPVKDFAIFTGGTGTKLITSYVTRAATLNTVSDIEIQTWSLDFSSGHPRAIVRCVLLGKRGHALIFRAIPSLPLPSLIGQIWKRYDAKAL